MRLDAQELKLNKEALAGILSESVGVETTLPVFNQTVDKVTAYCRSHGEIYDIVVEDMDRQSRDLKG